MADLLRDATFWTAVSFVLFIALVVWKARGVVVSSIRGRIDRIRSQLGEAESIRQDAKRVLTDLSERLEESESRCSEIISAAHDEARVFLSQSKERTDGLMKRREATALDRIRQEEQSAAREIHNMVVDRSISVARAILVKESGDLSGALFDEGLEALRSAKLN